MHAVSFIRTAQSVPDGQSDQGSICNSCGAHSIFAAEDEGVYRNPLSLDALLLRHPESTFFVEVVGKECEEVGSKRDGRGLCVPYNEFLGVRMGDILTIDRSVAPCVGHLILAIHDGVFVLARFTEHDGKQFLVAENGARNTYEISSECDVFLWGVVTAVITRL